MCASCTYVSVVNNVYLSVFFLTKAIDERATPSTLSVKDPYSDYYI